MEMGTQLTSKPSESKFSTRLINAMVTGNKQEINIILRNYKNDNGSVCFPALFSIRTEERLPVLFKEDPHQIVSIVSVALALSFESMNLTPPWMDSKKTALAETFLVTSKKVNWEMKELCCFLKNLIKADTGKC